MNCEKPLLAISLGFQDNGKRKIKLLPKRVDFNMRTLRDKYGDSLITIPCGVCLSCRLNRARDWANRCVLEASLRPDNAFVTLTYDDSHLPSSLVKAHLQAFIKKLRNDGHSIRYFGCGERGSLNGRPHYHVILFGYWPDDAVMLSKTNGNYLYTSKYLSSVWEKGFVTIGSVTQESAGYVARYTLKKVGGSNYKDEFTLMSTRPGIGYSYFEDHLESIYTNDKIVYNFGDSHYAKAPRYFDKKLEELSPDMMRDILDKRKAKSTAVLKSSLTKSNYENEEELLKGELSSLKVAIKSLKRRL